MLSFFCYYHEFVITVCGEHGAKSQVRSVSYILILLFSLLHVLFTI